MIDFLEKVEQSKVCSACHSRKTINFFSRKHSDCKKCAAEKSEIYRINNPEKVKKSLHACYIKHKEKRSAYSKAKRTKDLANDPGLRNKENEKSRAYRLSHGDLIRSRHRVRVENNPSKYANSRYKRKYGITLNGIDDLKRLQGDKCLICGNAFTTSGDSRPCTDHCHKSNFVRGILCNRCNKVEGLLGSIRVAKAMLKYMEKHHLFSYRE